MSQLTANINWGDGQTSVGELEVPKTGQFSVNGTHTYAKVGHYKVTVDVMEGSTEVAAIHTRAIVQQNSPGGRTIHADAGKAFSGVVALHDTAGDLSSTSGIIINIDWGDGSTITAGDSKKKTRRWELVLGTHTYTTAGTYRITISFITPPPAGGPGINTPDIAFSPSLEFSTAIVR
ncbi:MAG TPA: hypothetical protein VFW23_15985 [Tepidisphaeraceae bacterium]|nr:hypothetical protein [Tepidisphaeraceae bacterium]